MLRTVLIILVVVVSTIEFASPPNYGPFAPNAKPKQYSVIELTQRAVSPEQMEFRATPRSARLLETMSEADDTKLIVFQGDGKPLIGPVAVSPLRAPLAPPRAYRADLNRDGKSDYIIEIYSGGNGIASCFANVVFVISSNSNYETTIFRSDCPSADDFVDLLGDGRFQYVQPIFVSGSITGKDGRIHNYWVYNLYALLGGKFTSQNSLAPGFPKWIMYAGSVNHRSTTQLTEEQKRQMWIPHEQCLIWVPGDICATR